MIKKVRKRDGKIVDFDFNKIIEAVKKAFESQNEND
nr:MAG TPA: anaerobic ribonucleoside triphosphate reductase [Caudoviricetes sp.]